MAIIPIFIPHAGCPHQCVFCNQKTISGQKSAAVVEARRQIERWLHWIRPSREHEAAFYGGSFTGLELELQEQLLGLTDELLEQGIIGSVRLSTRPDYINPPVLRLLREHGVQLVELGVQSLDDAVLMAAERGHTASQVPEAVQFLREYGFKVGLQLMVGLPKQTRSSVEATVAQVLRLQPDIARIYPLLVIKDTPLEASYRRGDFTPLTLEEAVEEAAYMYAQLTGAGVQVIRVGLQPDEELCAEGNIVAGPFHPAMGELVKSRVMRDQLTPGMVKACGGAAPQEVLEVLCPPKLLSKVRGQKSCNVRYWEELLGSRVVVKQGDVGEVELKLLLEG